MKFLDGMPNRYKTPWLEALRGATYKQARAVLANENGYCCLGVLLDVCAPEYWVPRRDSRKKGVMATHAGEDESISYGELTPELLELLGIDADEAEALMSWNDNDELSFQQIANRIESGESPYDSSEE